MAGAADKLAVFSELFEFLTPEEQLEADQILKESTRVWIPIFEGPQKDAYESLADITFYGGSAGGGKTDLVIGAALTEHQRSMIYRRVGSELQAIIDRLAEIHGSMDGFNGKNNIWRLPACYGKSGDKIQIEFGAVPNLGDEKKYQGRPHDLKVFDEITSFLEYQFRFLITWLRTTRKGQRCRVICTGNPPVDAQGEWVIKFWAPWLDPFHPNPAKPGELRWFAAIDGKDIEVEDGTPFKHNGKLIRPQSRTFIPSRVTDNPYLMETGYEATLQALPEPLRSQMLDGNFQAGKEDNAFQVIPTAGVRAAQDRWTEEGKKGPMDSVGEDVARGGRCETVISRRHGHWYDKLLCYPGVATPDGASAASVAVAAVRDGAPIHVDVVGCGTSPYDHLKTAGVQVVPINGAAESHGFDKSRQLRFYNLRAELYWKMRESLDPASPDPVALPPGQDIRADLCAATWTLRAGKILIESKDDLIKRIGRSPDKGDAIIYASVETPKRSMDHRGKGHVSSYDPYKAAQQEQNQHHNASAHVADYDPYQ